MKASHINEEYENGVKEFFKFAQQNALVIGDIYVIGIFRIIQNGYGMVNFQTCKQSLTLSRLMYKSEFV